MTEENTLPGGSMVDRTHDSCALSYNFSIDDLRTWTYLLIHAW